MSSAAGCLRDITATDIMDYMQVDHPHNLKEMWKMKHATPARIGIGHCGPRYTTEAQLRFLASHAAANDAVFNEVPEEVVKELGVFEVRTKCIINVSLIKHSTNHAVWKYDSLAVEL